MCKKSGILIGSVFILLALSAGPVPGAYVWAPTDLVEDGALSDVYIGKVVTDPVNPNKVWGLTLNEFDPIGGGDPLPAKGLWLSTDKGATWTSMNDANLTYETHVADLAICASDPDIIYAATMFEGVFKSTNGGNSWVSASSGISHGGSSFPNNDWAVLAIAVEPDDPDNVYCSVAQLANIDIFNLGPDHPGFFRSTNGASSWTGNNSGLPATDGMKSAVASSIVIPHQAQSYVILGMLELELKISLFSGAKTKGRAFFSSNRAASSFTEISTGLPSVNADMVLLGVSVSGSLMYLSTSPANPVTVMASHLGVQASVDLFGGMEGMLNSGGVYNMSTSNGQWTEKTSGLPRVTDEYNDASCNAGSIAISPTSPSIALVGIFLTESGNPNLERDKIYVSTNGGGAWSKNWDDGMYTSPHGYRSPIPIITVFNSNMTAAYSSVHWSDEINFGEDSGVWSLPPATGASHAGDGEIAQYGPLTRREYLKQVEQTFARLPWPINMFNRNLVE